MNTLRKLIARAMRACLPIAIAASVFALIAPSWASGTVPKQLSPTGRYRVLAPTADYTSTVGSTWDEACVTFYEVNGFGAAVYNGAFTVRPQPGRCTVMLYSNTYVYAISIDETPQVCPANSQDTGSLCRCDDAFEPAADGKACVPSPGAPGAGSPGDPGYGGGSDGGGGAAGGGGSGGGSGSGSPPPSPPDSCQKEESGNPILPSSGAKIQFETDYTGSGPHALSFTRNFSSARFTGVQAQARSATGLGMAWSHNWAMAVRVNGRTAQVEMKDGSVQWFTSSGTGITAYWSPASGVDTLIWANGKLTYKRASDDSTWQFTGTRLASITQRNGWVTTLSYTGEQLTQVANHFGQSLRLAYGSSGQLASVTTPDGKLISYGVDAQGRSISVTYPDGTSKGYVYEDSRWPQALTGIVDERGIRFATFAYDALGRGIGTEHAGGAWRYSVSYGTGLATITNPLGAQYQHNYTVNGGAAALAGVSVARFAGDVANRTQNADGTIAAEADFLGISTLFTWDGARRLPLSTTRAAGRPEAHTVSTQWHPTLRVPVLVTEAGRSTAWTYDANGNALSKTVTDTATGQTRVWAWTYNAQGLATAMTDSRGGIWQFAYEARGNLLSINNPLNQQTSYTYDAAQRVIGETAPNGLVASYTYDSRVRLTQTVRGDETSSYSYTPSGQMASARLANGYGVSYSYDAAQRLVAATDSLGNSIQYTLDAAGNRIREEVKDAGGVIASVTGRIVNNLSRVTAVQGAVGQTTQLGYDANGEAISQTDPLNQTTRQTLDGLRRDLATTFADNSAAQQAWSQLEQLTQVTDPKGVATQYSYNAFGDVLSETSPDIGSINYTRNAAGEVTATRDARGQITSIKRDALGRPIEIHHADGQVSLYGWNAAGELTRMEGSSDLTSFERDLKGQIAFKDQRLDASGDQRNSSASYQVAYAYENGDLARIGYPSGLGVYYRRTNGRITGIDVLEPSRLKIFRPPVPFITNLAHTALGQPRSWTWRSGDTAARSFDADGRMVQSEIASYSYDAAGRITGITQNLHAKDTGTAYITPLAFTAGYDARNRLTSFVREGAETKYTYDANSNRVTAIDKVTSDTDLENAFANVDLAGTTDQALSIDAGSNKLLGFRQTVVRTSKGTTTSTVVTPVNYTLDENGAMTSDGLRSFEYDAAQRLSKVKVFKSGEAASVSYRYNALGQRVFKSEYEVEQKLPHHAQLGAGFINWLKVRFGWLYANARWDASIGTGYVYGDGQIPGWALLGEYDNGSASGAGRTEYIWLPVGNGDVIPVGMYRNGKLYAIHSDHLGTPRQMTDEAKAVVWQWPYSAFGNNKPTGVLKATAKPKLAVTTQAVQLEATPAVEMNLRMPGQYFDVETGDFYNWNRYLSPGKGRYTQVDPIGKRGGPNGYIYVGGDPLSFMDPYGKFAFAIPLVPVIISGADVAIGAGLGAIAYGLDKVFNRAQTPDQQALGELVRDTTKGGRKPLSGKDADTILDWGKEVGVPVRDDRDTDHWKGGPHIHVPGSGVGHVPVERCERN